MPEKLRHPTLTIYPVSKDFSRLKRHFISSLFFKLPFDNKFVFIKKRKSFLLRQKTCKKIKNSLEKTFVKCYVI